MAGRVLITGATGFVGSHIAEAFVKAGYEVRCGARDPSKPHWLSDLPSEIVPLDLEHPAHLQGALEDVETVVHAAGITAARKPADYQRINAIGTRRLVGAAEKSGVRRFVQISSLAARGPDGMGHPASDYGWSKRRAEDYLPKQNPRMETVVLRPAAVYGPRDTDLLPLFQLAKRGFLAAPYGQGALQPVYATDVARATLRAVDTPGSSTKVLPVAEARRYSWEQIARALEKAFGRKITPLRLPAAAFVFGGLVSERLAGFLGATPPFDGRRARDLAVYNWTCDVAKTEKALRWRAGVPLSEGLEYTARWYEENGWL